MIATAAAVAFVVFSCKGKLGEAQVLNLDEVPVQTVENMFISQTENSGLQMRAEAPLMERYENGEGLLQNLPSWNFVEWSKANTWVQDVNYPTNFPLATKQQWICLLGHMCFAGFQVENRILL